LPFDGSIEALAILVARDERNDLEQIPFEFSHNPRA